MQARLDNLPQLLQKNLAALYVVHGDEPLLALEAADSIRAAARKAGFGEREVLTVEPGFSWSQLNMAGASLSLFAEKRLLELRIPSGKPGVEGAQALQDYCANLSPDTLTLITLPKLDKTAQNSKWFQALEHAGVTLAAYPVERQQLPQWIAGRLAQQGQQADRETLQFLTDKVEGNLLAAHQEIQKLGLLFPPGPLAFDDVQQAVLDVSRYDVFKLGSAILSGDPARVTRVIDGLKAEGEAAVLVLWAISEEVRYLLKMAEGLQRNVAGAQLLRDLRVWGERQKLLEPAARRQSLPKLRAALLECARLDRMSKGLEPGDVFDDMLKLALSLCRGTQGFWGQTA